MRFPGFVRGIAPLLMLAGMPRPALASVGPNGQIAYAVYENGFYDVWVMNADGSGQVNLTNTPDRSEWQPVWSPDGTKLAFTRDDAALGTDLWSMNADGSDQRDITNSPEPEYGPSWSPDGERLTFTRQVPGIEISTQSDIFTIGADGSNPVNLTNSDWDELGPAWSPDGARIAFAGVRGAPFEGDWEIVTMNPDGSGEAVLTLATQEDYAPAWSPDGRMIVFMSQFDEPCCGDWEIWAMNRDGSGLTNLTNNPAGDTYPSWSPDGTLITFSSNRADGWSTDIFTLPAPTILPPAAPPAAAQRITLGGQASDPSWGRQPGAVVELTIGLRGGGAGRVTSTPHGIDCGLACSATFAPGTRMILRARPRGNSRFAGWTGACAGQPRRCVLTLDTARTAIARFRRVP